jgi:tetratricopeptide (TPR) repeat protein
MDNRRANTKSQIRKTPVAFKWIGIAGLTVMLCFAVLYYFNPKIFHDISFSATRVKNTFEHYVLKEKPLFYYLEMEKNGQDVRIAPEEAFEITYRDEFVVKSVASDDLKGKFITVTFDGFTANDNDFRVLLKGLDFVNKIITQGQAIDHSGVVSGYNINVRFRGETIALIPLKILVTPQDWFRFAKESSNVKQQIEYLKNAISLNERDVSVRKILAGVYLRQNMIDDAIYQYNEVLKIAPDDTVAMLELAKGHIKKKDYDEAIKVSKSVIRINPQEAEAYVAIALSMEEKGLWAPAAQNYTEAVRLEPGNLTLRFKMADALKNAQKINEAGEAYKYIAENAKESKEAGDAFMMLGDIYLQQKKYDDAVRAYQEVVKKQPRNVAAYANLASAYAGAGKFKEELSALQKAVSLKSDDPTIRFNLGAAYERQKMEAEAIKEYERVLKINVDDADAVERLADLALKNKQFGQAIQYYEKLKTKHPRKASIYAGLGFAYGEQKKYRESAQNYENAIKYGAKDSNLYYNLGYAYEKMGMEKKAVVQYEKMSPITKDVLNIVAPYYLKEKNCSKAIRYYQRIVDLEPKNADSYSGLGYAHATCGNTDMAINHYKTALKLDAENDDAYANLGEAYEKKGMYPEALDAYTKAYRLNPDSAKAAQRIPRLNIKLLQEKAQKKTGE